MSSHVGEPASPRTSARSGRRVTLALLALVLVLAGARLLLRAEHGLTAQYFADADAGGVAALTVVDDDPSTAILERRWTPVPPDVFRVRWYGFIGVSDPGDYSFTITADDGAVLTVDGTTLIDTGPGRGTFVQAAGARLSAGPHPVVIEYRQSGGAFRFEWSWSRDGGPQEPIPAWRLATSRSAWATQRAARSLDAGLVLVAGLLVVWVAARKRTTIAAAARRRQMILVLLLFVVLAAIQTWPLASDPAHLSRNDNADTVLNEWALAWVAHQAVHDPLRLFDANIFYPERYTLAYSESMIVQAAMAAPLLWAGMSPVLVYNILVIVGFALNGFVMTWVMRRWTGEMVPSVAAGILFAFNSNILTRLPHMQALHVEFLPMALFAWDRLLREPRVRHAVVFGAMVALQSLTSVYLLVFTFSAVCAAVLARAAEWIGPRFRAIAPLVLLAAGVAGVITTPFLLPYLWAHADQGFERSLDDARNLAATFGSYLASPSQLHYGLWSYRFFDNPSALFPGVTAVVLALVAVGRGTAFRNRQARLGLAVLVCGVLLSFGPKIPGYGLLFTYVPIYRVVRVVSSFGYLALAGLAIVAGYGLLELHRLLSRRVWPVAAASILVLIFVEPLAAPIELVRFEGIPRIYGLVRNEPKAIVVELPFLTASAGFQQATYMLNSTQHWRPMLNGYSGYRPESYYQTAEALHDFPAEPAIDWLRRRGVTHMFVHLDAYGGDLQSRLASTPGVHQVASDRGIVLYRLDVK